MKRTDRSQRSLIDEIYLCVRESGVRERGSHAIQNEHIVTGP
jgi:hypothetical protein